jgi:hypothetical protein
MWLPFEVGREGEKKTGRKNERGKESRRKRERKKENNLFCEHS